MKGGVSEVDLQVLVDVLPNTNIEHLNIAFNRIGDSGLELLAGALDRTKLKSLELETAGINSRGAEALARVLMEGKSDLTRVGLSHNNIGGAAQALVEAAAAHPKLEHIGHEGTPVRC